MKKRLIEFAGILLAVGVIFAGCSGQKTETKARTTQASGETDQKSAAGTTEAGDTETASDGETDGTRALISESDVRKEVLQHYSNLFVVTGSDLLNVREEPSSSAKIVGTIVRNGGGSVLGTSQDGNWYEITSGGVHGYVAVHLVTTGDEAEEAAVQNARLYAVILNDGVNLRDKADLDTSTVIGTANKGDQFLISGSNSSFYKILLEDGTGAYVSTTVATSGYYLKEAVASAKTGETETEKASQKETAEETTREATKETTKETAKETTQETVTEASSKASETTKEAETERPTRRQEEPTQETETTEKPEEIPAPESKETAATEIPQESPAADPSEGSL